MSQETIKTYQDSSVGVSQCLVTLEGFVGDMENAELADDSTVDTSDAVIAINGLIGEIERREAEIERLRAALERYGLHTWDCDSNESKGEKPCNCGWSAYQQPASSSSTQEPEK